MKKTTHKVKDFYECPRCEINSSTRGEMCPCPRGGCEAAITGSIKTTTIVEVVKELTKEQRKWNKQNYR